MQALTYLQRALLVHDLQALDALEWESCFNKVTSWLRWACRQDSIVMKSKVVCGSGRMVSYFSTIFLRSLFTTTDKAFPTLIL